MENKATLSKQDKEALDNAAIEFCQYADNVNEEFSFDDDAYPTFKSGAEWGILYGRNSIPSLQSEIDRLKEENLNLKESLKKLFGYMDSGFLIRDISKDHEPGWAMKMLPFQMDLKEAYERIK